MPASQSLEVTSSTEFEQQPAPPADAVVPDEPGGGAGLEEDAFEVPRDPEMDRTPLTREERLAMAKAMTENCNSLSALLQRLVAEEQQLKEACAEFLIRDVEEENARIALTTRCVAEQEETAKASAFVKWALEREKGPLAHGAPPLPGPPTANYTCHTLEVDGFFARIDGVDAPPAWSPLSAVHTQELLGWRGRAAADSSANGIQESKDAMSSSSSWALATVLQACRSAQAEPSVCCINGCPLRGVPQAPSDDTTVMQAAFEAARRAVSPTTDGLEARFVSWRDAVLATSVRTPMTRLLDDVPRMQQLVADDGSDGVSFVPLSRLTGALHFTAVLLDGRVIAAETPMPEVRIDATIVGVSLPDAVEYLQRCLDRSTADVFEPSAPPPVEQGGCPAAPVLRVLRCCAKVPPSTGAGDDDAAGGRRILLSSLWGQRLTPATPMERFEWSDMCGIARLAKSNPSTSPILRFTKVRVAEVEGAPAAEASWIAHLCNGTAPVQYQPTSPPEDRRVRPTSVAMVGAAVAAAAAVVLGVALRLARKT